MQTATINTYTFQELEGRAKEKARQWLTQDLPIFEDYEQDYQREELAKLGYEDIEFAYSGFYCQGDGASITCTVNIPQYLKRHQDSHKYRSLLYWLRQAYGSGSGGVKITRARWGHYVHHHLLQAETGDLLWDLEVYGATPAALAQAEEVAQGILEEVKDKSVELYKQIVSEYEACHEDEYLIDMCEANDYRFDATGDPVHHLIREAA